MNYTVVVHSHAPKRKPELVATISTEAQSESKAISMVANGEGLPDTFIPLMGSTYILKCGNASYAITSTNFAKP